LIKSGVYNTKIMELHHISIFATFFSQDKAETLILTENSGMKITLLTIGKTDEKYLKDGMDIYHKRLGHYIPLEILEIPVPKKWNNLQPSLLKQKEGEIILRHMEKSDYPVLLDEKGRSFSSMEFSSFLQKQMNLSVKNLLFVVGGPWGFSDEVYKKAALKISLSPMTFSHQMIRLFFLEQLYRAFSILRNEAYHNE